MGIEASFVRTEDGLVIRQIGVSSECAWRFNNDGSWARCLDHKGPWLSIDAINVPIEILLALKDVRDALLFKAERDDTINEGEI